MRSQVNILRIGLRSLGEPCLLVYSIGSPSLEQATANLMALLPASANASETDLVLRCRDNRIERVGIMDEALKLTVSINAR